MKRDSLDDDELYESEKDREEIARFYMVVGVFVVLILAVAYFVIER